MDLFFLSNEKSITKSFKKDNNPIFSNQEFKGLKIQVEDKKNTPKTVNISQRRRISSGNYNYCTTNNDEIQTQGNEKIGKITNDRKIKTLKYSIKKKFCKIYLN